MKKCPKRRQCNGNRGNKSQSSQWTGMHLEDLVQGLVEEQSVYMLSLVYKAREYDVTGMINVFSFDAYDFLDLGAYLYFLTPYVTMKFYVLLEKLIELFNISTLVGEFESLS